MDYIKDDSIKKINREKLREKLEYGHAIVIDVLNPKQFKENHIKGAVNIPLEEIGDEAKKRFRSDRELIVYDDGKGSLRSKEAAEKLLEAGFRIVYNYEAGKRDWRQAGFPVVQECINR